MEKQDEMLAASLRASALPNGIKQATPTETPAGGQPIQFGRRHDAHRSAGGLINPISEGAIGLLRDQKATEDDDGLGEARRAAHRINAHCGALIRS